MASIQKLVRHRTDPTTGKHKQVIRYRVFIRKKGIPVITEIFNTKKLAQDFAARIEGDREALRAYGNNAVRSMTLANSSTVLSSNIRNPIPGSCITSAGGRPTMVTDVS